MVVMADADPLAAALEGIRAREQSRDVPALLAAVEAALEVHALAEHVRLSCRPHARYGWDPLCPKCDEYDGCTACSYVPVRPEQCETRQAITKALLGEAVTGGPRVQLPAAQRPATSVGDALDFLAAHSGVPREVIGHYATVIATPATELAGVVNCCDDMNELIGLLSGGLARLTGGAALHPDSRSVIVGRDDLREALRSALIPDAVRHRLWEALGEAPGGNHHQEEAPDGA